MLAGEAFDPDELNLTKPEIMAFCDRVLAKWNKDPAKNAPGILAMNAIKTGVLWTDEDSLRAVWGEIVGWSFDLLYQNALAQGKKNGVDWTVIMKKLGENSGQS